MTWRRFAPPFASALSAGGRRLAVAPPGTRIPWRDCARGERPRAARTAWLAFAVAVIVPAAAAALSGGPYEVDSSSLKDAAGGAALSGGPFAVRGALGQRLPAFRPGGGAFVLRRGFYDPPRLSLQAGLSYQLEGPGGALLFLPAGAVDRPLFEAPFRRDPANAPLAADPALIALANEKMRRNRGPLAEVGAQDVWEVALHDEVGWLDGALLASAEISLPYRDADGDGIVDGTPVRVGTLDLWRLDEGNALWVRVPSARTDAAGKLVSAGSPSLSVFALIGGSDRAVSEVYAFPVPFRPNGPSAGTGAGQTGTDAAGITFANLPSEGTIEIYTLDGRRVRRLEIPPNLAPASLSWDVKNDGGAKVVSGVYIWRVSSGGGDKIGRLMVIR